MIIDFDGIPIEILRKPIKNMNLRIYPHGEVKVSAPLKFNDTLILKFLNEKSGWIRVQYERMKARAIATPSALKTGASVPFMGKNYLLIIEEHHGPSKVQLQDELLRCFVKAGSSELLIQKLLERWYKREMAAILPELIRHWEAIIGVSVNEWGIKKMKTRWGSCNTRAHRIWLNLNLIKKPLICLEYVLVHELVHLLEASHNKRFHTLMTHFMPQWREYQILLEGK